MFNNEMTVKYLKVAKIIIMTIKISNIITAIVVIIFIINTFIIIIIVVVIVLLF